MSSDRTPTSDEVQRRVGRNLIIFQQIEFFLKFILENSSSTHILPHGANAIVETSAGGGRPAQQTLGTLVRTYLSDVLVEAGLEEMPESESPETAQCVFRFKFTMESEGAFVQRMRADLKLMTEQRNELVHHFLPRWKPGDETALNDALAYLDVQRDKVLPMFEHLKEMSLWLQRMRKSTAELFASPDFQRQFELFRLEHSPLISLFRQVHGRDTRADGWTYLSSAANVAAKALPDELAHLVERYGFKTLKQLLIGSELFDVMDEGMPKGGSRTLFRLRESH
jgi:hypothetical protein